MKNEAKKELNMLHDEISYILEKLDVNLTTLQLRYNFFEKPHDFEKERESKLPEKEEIIEIERLKEEVENNMYELLDNVLDSETKTSKLLPNLKYGKKNIAQYYSVRTKTKKN